MVSLVNLIIIITFYVLSCQLSKTLQPIFVITVSSVSFPHAEVSSYSWPLCPGEGRPTSSPFPQLSIYHCCDATKVIINRRRPEKRRRRFGVRLKKTPPQGVARRACVCAHHAFVVVASCHAGRLVVWGSSNHCARSAGTRATSTLRPYQAIDQSRVRFFVPWGSTLCTTSPTATRSPVLLCRSPARPPAVALRARDPSSRPISRRTALSGWCARSLLASSSLAKHVQQRSARCV